MIAEKSKEKAMQALAVAPAHDNRVQSRAYWGLAHAYQVLETYADAAEAYQKAIHYGRASGNAVAEMMSVAGAATMAFEGGQLRVAFELASQVVKHIERANVLPPISAVIYGVLGWIHYQWDQRQQARQYIQRTLELTTLGGYNSGLTFCRVLHARLHQLEGDLTAATSEIQKAHDRVQAQVPEDVRQEVLAQQVRLYLAQHRLAAAQMALQRERFAFQDEIAFPDLSSGRSFTHTLGQLYNSGLRVLLYGARTCGDTDWLNTGIVLANSLIARVNTASSHWKPFCYAPRCIRHGGVLPISSPARRIMSAPWNWPSRKASWLSSWNRAHP